MLTNNYNVHINFHQCFFKLSQVKVCAYDLPRRIKKKLNEIFGESMCFLFFCYLTFFCGCRSQFSLSPKSKTGFLPPIYFFLMIKKMPNDFLKDDDELFHEKFYDLLLPPRTEARFCYFSTCQSKISFSFL